MIYSTRTALIGHKIPETNPASLGASVHVGLGGLVGSPATMDEAMTRLTRDAGYREMLPNPERKGCSL